MRLPVAPPGRARADAHISAAGRHAIQSPVAAEVLDEDSVLACRERADQVEAVRVVLVAEATRREPETQQDASFD
jgi:hypothetical protein